MASWTDGRVESSTVATTTQSQVGSTINIPANQSWDIYRVYGAGTGGSFQLTVDSLPGANFSWLQQSNAGFDEIGPDGDPYLVSIQIRGPASLKNYVTNDAATSTLCGMYMQYSVTEL